MKKLKKLKNIYKCDRVAGNGQRNFASTRITNPDTLLYYLDDDNIIHPDLYKLLDFIDDKTIFAFDQDNRMKGKNINVGYIDAAMVIIPFNSCKNTKLDIYEADAYYIKVVTRGDPWVSSLVM